MMVSKTNGQWTIETEWKEDIDDCVNYGNGKFEIRPYMEWMTIPFSKYSG